MISMDSINSQQTSNNGNVQRDDDYRKRILQSMYEAIQSIVDHKIDINDYFSKLFNCNLFHIAIHLTQTDTS